MKAAKKGRLLVGDMSINVGMYLALDMTGINTHIYHLGCGTRINQPRICPDHPDIAPVATYSAIDLGDQQIVIAFDERRKILQSDSKDWPVVASLSLDKLGSYIATQKLVSAGLYSLMAPPTNFDTVAKSPDALLLRSLTDHLRRNKIALICMAPAHGCLRPCLLTATGTNMNDNAMLNLMPLVFREEIRHINQAPNSDNTYGKMIEYALRTVPPLKASTIFSNKPLINRISMWIDNRMAKPKLIKEPKSGSKVLERQR